VNIAEPAPLLLTETHVNVACNGGAGSIDLTSLGGIAPYNYLWNDGTLLEDRINIPAGTYSVTVSDNNACTSLLNVSVGSNSGIVITQTHNDVKLFRGTNADIQTNVSGGLTPYTYIWNDGVAVPNRINIGAGNYALSVTDSNSCVQDPQRKHSSAGRVKYRRNASFSFMPWWKYGIYKYFHFRAELLRLFFLERRINHTEPTKSQCGNLFHHYYR